MKRIIIIISLIALLAACGGNKMVKRNPRPQWLDAPQSRYPDSSYLSAIGSGSSRSNAEKDAAAKISQIFHTSITATERMQRRYEELTKGRNTTTEDFASNQKDITLSSSESLINLKYGDSYTDNNGKVHVIAFINRLETGSIYEEMLIENSKQINYYSQKAKESTEPLDAYAYCGAAWTISVQNEDLLRQFKIISPTLSAMYQPQYNQNTVKQQYVDAARKVSFTVEVNGEHSDRLQAMAKRILSEQGFSTMENDGYITVTGNLNTYPTDLKRKDGTVFVRWDASIALTQPDGSAIINLAPSGKSGSVSEQEALSRVFIDLEKKLNKEIPRELTQWLDNLVIKGN